MWARAGLAACQGHRAAPWLFALPAPGVAGVAIPGAAMTAAVRLRLGVAPLFPPAAPRRRCGADVYSDGRHLLSACPQQELRRARLHDQIVEMVAAALRRTPGWDDVVVESGLDDAHGVLRLDLRAKRGLSGVMILADISVA